MSRLATELFRSPDGTIEVEVLPEAGARLHRLRAFGTDLLRTPDDPEAHLREPFFWGAYVMAPWGGRVDAGTVQIGSRRLALRSNFPDGSAIHGQVYARPWVRAADGRFHVRGGGDGWPWTYGVELGVEAGDRSVRIDLALTNESDEPMPGGLGLHPWFRRPVLLAIRGDSVHPMNARSEPLPVPVSGPFDVRQMGELREGIDATWTQLADPPVRLRWPRAGVAATMQITSPTVYVVAASPAELDATAVEPQTHAPQGIRRLLVGEPGALAMLDPGATLYMGIELVFERLGDGPG